MTATAVFFFVCQLKGLRKIVPARRTAEDSASVLQYREASATTLGRFFVNPHLLVGTGIAYRI